MHCNGMFFLTDRELAFLLFIKYIKYINRVIFDGIIITGRAGIKTEKMNVNRMNPFLFQLVLEGLKCLYSSTFFSYSVNMSNDMLQIKNNKIYQLYLDKVY